MARAIWQGRSSPNRKAGRPSRATSTSPPDAVNRAFLAPSETTTVCGWKGTAHYYSIEVGGERNADAAWYYPDPKPAASNIRDHVAFWRGVTVET